MPDSKDDEVPFLLWVRHFPRKMGEDDQSPNTLKNFSSYEIRFKKGSLKHSKNTGGGSRLFGKNPNISIFFPGWLPLMNH